MACLTIHPEFDGARFTLRGLFVDADDAQAKADELEQAGHEIQLTNETAPSGRDLTHVLARREVARSSRAGLPHEHTTPWEAVRVALDRFRRHERAAQRKGREFPWYKPLNVHDLKATIEAWSWEGTIQDVAAGILADTIRAHPFPNGNHRTALFLAREYLDAVDVTWPSYSLRGRGIHRFYNGVEPFVHESKYLLQVLRRRPMLTLAHEEGYTELQVIEEGRHPLKEADLTATHDQLEDKHERAAARLLSDLAADEDEDKLSEDNSIGLADWVGHCRS